jgi:hypothetical protein
MSTRREFLKKAGWTAAVAATPAIARTTPAKEKNTHTLKQSKIRLGTPWDVIVAGGGPAGCAAAAAAAREGARTLLIENTGCLGGMGTSGLLNAWCPFTDKEKIIYRGIAQQVFLAAKKGVPHIKGNDWVPINTEHLKTIYDDLITTQGVTPLLLSTVAAVEMKDKNTLDALIVANKAGLTAYKAKIFIDCTGDGDLAAWSGAPFDLGDPEGHLQQATLCFSISNIDPYHYQLHGPLQNNYPNSPLAHILQDPAYPLINDAHLNDKMPAPALLAFNAGHITLDPLDPHSLTQAMITGRQIAGQFHQGLTQHAPQIFASSYLNTTASLPGIRESRRIHCDYTFTLDDWQARRDFPDSIGRNAYYIDLHHHNATRYPRYNKGESHGIPYRILTPINHTNLLVAGRCVSTDHYAHGSLRVMPPCLVTGEAAGMAAAHAIHQTHNNVHHIDIPHLRQRLQEEGQLL